MGAKTPLPPRQPKPAVFAVIIIQPTRLPLRALLAPFFFSRPSYLSLQIIDLAFGTLVLLVNDSEYNQSARQ